MVAIIDYDAGNIGSVEKALKLLGSDAVLTDDRDLILSADHVILPGVGAFGDAMDKLTSRGLVPVIREVAAKGTPFLGICLGLQLMFDSSEESPGVKGLSLLPGKILRLPEGEGRKIPHMGWNSLSLPKPTRLFEGIAQGSFVYFVHSFYLKADNSGIVAATAEYGATIHAAAEAGNLFGCQFHPEKSSAVGLRILKNFLQTS